MIQNIILKIIRFLWKFLKKNTQYKLLLGNNPVYEPGYRDNAISVKEVKEEAIKPQHPYMEYIVTDQSRACPICSYSLIKKWQCRPDNRRQLEHLKKKWHSAPTCATDGVHFHCYCDDCGCRWIVPLNVKMQKIELL